MSQMNQEHQTAATILAHQDNSNTVTILSQEPQVSTGTLAQDNQVGEHTHRTQIYAHTHTCPCMHTCKYDVDSTENTVMCL